MLIIGKCMIRNKPDSYCQAHDLDTRGVSRSRDRPHQSLLALRLPPGARPTHLVHRTTATKGNLKVGGGLRRMWQAFLKLFGGSKPKKPEP